MIRYIHYILKTGDTLWKISRKFDITIEDILDANSWIDDPDDIQVGWVLKIPDY